MESRRVAVTGIGVASPLGLEVEAFWAALCEGRSGVAPVQSFDAGASSPFYAAEVGPIALADVGVARKKAKTMGRPAQLALYAASKARDDAGLADTDALVPRARIGACVGIGMLSADAGEIGRAVAAAERSADGSVGVAAFARGAGAEMSPLWLLRHIPNMASAHTTIAFDLRGPSNTIVTGWTAGVNAIGEAARIVARGDADVMFAGGSDARVCPFGTLRYRELGWLSTRRDVEPERVSAPFDRSASGFVNGEGAAILVLEALDHAVARGAKVYAEVAGYAGGNDAYDLERPHPEGRGLALAVVRCAAASRERSAPDAVFAPAPGVPEFDAATARALSSTLSFDGGGPAVTATRSLLGNTHSASSAFDAAAAALAIRDGVVPPVANLEEPIAPLDFVHGEARARRVRSALVAAYGFGGNAAALLLSEVGS